MQIKVFVDGQEGTTGLQINQRLGKRDDIELLEIDPALRKDSTERQKLINQSDVVFLCLPDEAAIEAVKLCDNSDTIIIDASTAHRVNPKWAYGLPELSNELRKKISESKSIANPGCYATGANCIIYPLVAMGILPPDYPLSIHAVSGYSGAGKRLIAIYEDDKRDSSLIYPRQYALGLTHKHLPEIEKISGLAAPPLFNPLICDYYAGMEVSVPLFTNLLNNTDKKGIYQALKDHYADQTFIRVEMPADDLFLSAGEHTDTNFLTIYVCGNDQQLTLVSVLDNLGKGASGAAVQNMNIALGLDETLSLI